MSSLVKLTFLDKIEQKIRWESHWIILVDLSPLVLGEVEYKKKQSDRLTHRESHGIALVDLSQIKD